MPLYLPVRRQDQDVVAFQRVRHLAAPQDPAIHRFVLPVEYAERSVFAIVGPYTFRQQPLGRSRQASTASRSPFSIRNCETKIMRRAALLGATPDPWVSRVFGNQRTACRF